MEMGDSWKEQCGKLLRKLMRNDPLARPFNKPVDPTLFPDYYTIVTDPIDLGTIKGRLESGEYADRDEFAAEVRRVWDNCYRYAAAGTDVHRMATELSRTFEAKFKEVGTVVEAEVGAASSSNEMKKMQKQMTVTLRRAPCYPPACSNHVQVSSICHRPR